MKELAKQWVRYEQWKALYKRYERILIPAILLFGVAVDFLTFRSINLQTFILLLAVYTILAGATIAYMHFYDEKLASPTRGFALRYMRLSTPLVLQFLFGALLSASLIFYWFSGAFSVSWPLLVLVALLMIGNDQWRHIYLRPTVQLGVYFFTLFSLFTLALPFFLNSIEPQIFFLSGFLSLALAGAYLRGLSSIIKRIDNIRRRIMTVFLAIFLSMNALYILNVIPPIPLSLREAGTYHRITRMGDSYTVLTEKTSWLENILPGTTLHLERNDPAYVFSAIFAPTELRTRIVHVWQYYDPSKRAWIEKDALSFSVVGGRDAGYRGYSMKSALAPGKWRVDVQTPAGQTLGRVRFDVETVSELPKLVEIKQ
ncbi:DUF2914 domain-containing protein [Candidatus Uhrbacteria bacterium]|nr:DUF2914 domain-containing protein [Candidatus Uhrbacteria bacterium]